jgi:acylpyruvate hydrolase
VRLGTLAQDGTTLAVVIADGSATPVQGYVDVGALLAAGDPGLKAARDAAAAGGGTSFDSADLRSPISKPSAVFCVGLNYRTHILEMGRELPTDPTLFSKLPRTLTGPFDEVVVPAVSSEVDYEGELVVVIGREGRDIPEEKALDYIVGYTLMNDVSMRDWQFRSLQWFAGKNFERSTPVGPWVVTPDEIDLEGASISVTVNGELRQQAALSELVFEPVKLVSDISRFTTLMPGDLIATGSPGGVAHAMKPPAYLAGGDVVEVTIEQIGSLRTTFVSQ